MLALLVLAFLQEDSAVEGDHAERRIEPYFHEFTVSPNDPGLDGELRRVLVALDLVEALSDPARRDHARNELLELGDIGIGGAALGLGSNNPRVREAAAVWLSQCDAPVALEVLRVELEAAADPGSPEVVRLHDVFAQGLSRSLMDGLNRTVAPLGRTGGRGLVRAEGVARNLSPMQLSPQVLRQFRYQRVAGRVQLQRKGDSPLPHPRRAVEERLPAGARTAVDGVESPGDDGLDSELPAEAGEGSEDRAKSSPEEPNRITVYYGTNREKAEPDVGWYLRNQRVPALTLAGALFFWWFLSRILKVGAWRVARFLVLMVSCAAILMAALACRTMVIDYQRVKRLGVEFGGDRDEAFNRADRKSLCHLGECEVSVPRDHVLGSLARESILQFLKTGAFLEDPETQFVVLRISEYSGLEEFESKIEAAASAAGGEQRAFVFVHGFNVSFEDAARRTAQIAVDLGFPGAPIFFSWPSRADVVQYTVDESAVEWSIRHLVHFLMGLRQKMPNADLHLIAHSMGNRALTKALTRVQRRLRKADLRGFQEVILAAPDIDAETFREDIFPAMRGGSDRVTLYTSSADKALIASLGVHGYPRAGQQLVLLEDLETVLVDLDFSPFLWLFRLNHGYVGEARKVLEDLREVLVDRRQVQTRKHLAPEETEEGLQYWRLSSAQ
jgi:esterase/lipase superfamily enzyme